MLTSLKPNAHWLLRTAVFSVFGFHGALKLLDLAGFAAMLPISYPEVVLLLSLLFFVIVGNDLSKGRGALKSTGLRAPGKHA